MELDTHKKVILICVLLALMTFGAYDKVASYGFVYDDWQYIEVNYPVHGGLSAESVKWAFTSLYAFNWHPVTWLSHLADISVYGVDPGGAHVTNLLLHITNTILLFLILQWLTGCVWASAFTAVLFAIHPLHVESVAWISERKDLLSCLFFLITIAAYNYYAKNATLGRYVLVFLSLAVGLMCKPMLVTVPFVLLLLDYWPLERLSVKSVVEKVPLFGLCVAGCVMTVIAQKQGAMELGKHLTHFERIGNALASYMGYLSKTFYPVKLAVFYPHPRGGLEVWKAVAGAVLIVVITILAITKFRNKKYVAVGWFIFLGMLVPVIGLVQVGTQAMADRYTYIPLIGIFSIISLGAGELASKWRRGKVVLGVGAGVVICVLFMCTRVQAGYWKDMGTLYKRAVDVTEGNYIMHNNYGTVLRGEGKYSEAIEQFQKASAISPTYSKTYKNLGAVYLDTKQYNVAESYLLMAIRYNPDYWDSYYQLGKVLKATGDNHGASKNLLKSLSLNPMNPDAYFYLGNVMLSLGEYAKATEYYRKTIEIDPTLFAAYNNLGNLLTMNDEYEQALEYYQRGLEYQGANALSYKNMGMVYSFLGDNPKAVENFEKYLDLENKRVDVLLIYSRLLSADSDAVYFDGEKSLSLASRACELTGNMDARSLDVKAYAYASMEQYDSALSTWQKAAAIAKANDDNESYEMILSHMRRFKAKKDSVEGK